MCTEPGHGHHCACRCPNSIWCWASMQQTHCWPQFIYFFLFFFYSNIFSHGWFISLPLIRRHYSTWPTTSREVSLILLINSMWLLSLLCSVFFCDLSVLHTPTYYVIYPHGTEATEIRASWSYHQISRKLESVRLGIRMIALPRQQCCLDTHQILYL